MALNRHPVPRHLPQDEIFSPRELLEKGLRSLGHLGQGLAHSAKKLGEHVKENYKLYIATIVPMVLAIGWRLNAYTMTHAKPVAHPVGVSIPPPPGSVAATLPFSDTQALTGTLPVAAGDGKPPDELKVGVAISTPPTAAPSQTAEASRTATRVAMATQILTPGEQAVQEISKMKKTDNIFGFLLSKVGTDFFPQLKGSTWGSKDRRFIMTSDGTSPGIGYDSPVYNTNGNPFAVVVSFDSSASTLNGPAAWPGNAPGIVIMDRSPNGLRNRTNNRAIWINNFIDAAGKRVFQLVFTATNKDNALIGIKKVDLSANGANSTSRLGLLFTPDAEKNGTVFTLVDLTPKDLLYRNNLSSLVGDDTGSDIFTGGQFNPNGDFGANIFTSSSGRIELSEFVVLGDVVKK